MAGWSSKAASQPQRIGGRFAHHGAVFKKKAITRMSGRTSVEELQQVLGIGSGRLAAGEIGQIRTKAGRAELRSRLKSVIASNALALTPPPRLIRTEVGSANLLRVARGAAEI